FSECSHEARLQCMYARLRLADADLYLNRESAALANYQSAMTEIEETHKTLAPTDFLKEDFFQRWASLYSIGIELQFRRGEFRAALETAELARSRGFLDLLASRDIHQDTAVVPELTALTLRGAAPTTIRSDAVAPAPTADALIAVAARLRSTMV